MSIQNSTVNTANAAQIIDTTKDLANSPVGQEIMSGRHSSTGETVRATTSGKSDLLDALEELGMAKAGRSKVDTSKVKVKKGAGTDLDALGRIAEYLDKLPDLPKDQKHRDLVAKFGQYEEHFRRGEGDPATGDELRQALLEYSSDITHQFAALEAMRADAAERNAPAAYLAELDALRAEMRAPDKAREIVAGFRSAQVAHTIGEQTGGDAADFRDTYRQLLRGGTNLSQIFERMQSFSLSENLETVLEGFIKVAGDDMSAFGPTVDPKLLGDVLKELSTLKQMVSVLGMARETLDKAERLPGVQRTDSWPAPVEFAGLMLDFTDAPVAGMARATEMLKGFPKDDAELQAMLINLVRDFHASLPNGVNKNDAQVLQQKAILLTLSDKLVDREEQLHS